MADKIEVRDYDSFKTELERNPAGLLEQAAAREMNFSQFGNRACPSVLIEEKRNISNKLMEDFGYLPRGNSFLKATTADEFFDTAHGRTLAYDYLYRNHVANYGKRDVPYLPVSNTETLFPEAQGTPRTETSLEPRFDPNALIAVQSNAASSSYNIFRWVPTEADLQRERVLPGTDLPIMQLAEQEAPITLKKWGIGAELTYEAVRRESLDKIGTMINLEMDVERSRQLSEFIKVTKDGDERNGKQASDGTTLNTAAVSVTRAAIDASSSAKTITLRGLMMFFGGWPKGRRCTHVVCRLARAVDIALLTLGNNNTLVGQIANMEGIPGFVIPGIGGRVTVLIADDDDVGEDELIGLDASSSLEKINETGAAIRQQAEQIKNQTRLMTFSDTYGLAKVIVDSTRVYDLT